MKIFIHKINLATNRTSSKEKIAFVKLINDSPFKKLQTKNKNKTKQKKQDFF